MSLSNRKLEVSYGFINLESCSQAFKNRCTEVELCILQLAVKACVQKRAGDHRVCNSCRSVGCDCNFGNSGVQAEAPRTLGCNLGWNELALRKRTVFDLVAFERKFKSQKGQSVVEFAIVAFVVLSVIVALIVLFNKLNDGTFLAHAMTSSSHNVTHSIAGVIDAFSF